MAVVAGMVPTLDDSAFAKFDAPRTTSHVAKVLREKMESLDQAEHLEALMAESIDSILRAQHVASERERPQPERVVKALAVGRRAQLVVWIMQTFDVLGLDDAMVHGVALNIDRFCASCDGALPQNSLQCLLLAAACTEFKIDGFSDHPDKEWKRVLRHMSQGRVPMLDILRFECHVLSRLQYVVGLPTPFTFLKSLATRLQPEEKAPQWRCLATFLLELVLMEPEIQHGFPHAYLAAGALAAAFRVLAAPPERREELLEDVALWPVPGESGDELLAVCEEELLQLWIRCKACLVEFYPVFCLLEARYCQHSKFRVALLSPDMALKALREEREEEDIKNICWSRWGISGALRQSESAM